MTLQLNYTEALISVYNDSLWLECMEYEGTTDVFVDFFYRKKYPTTEKGWKDMEIDLADLRKRTRLDKTIIRNCQNGVRQ